MARRRKRRFKRFFKKIRRRVKTVRKKVFKGRLKAKFKKVGAKIRKKSADRRRLKKAGVFVIPRALVPMIAPLLPVIMMLNRKAGFKAKAPYKNIAFFHEYYVKGNKNAKTIVRENFVDVAVKVVKAIIGFVRKLKAKRKGGREMTPEENEVLDVAEDTIPYIDSPADSAKAGSFGLMYSNYGWAELVQMNVKMGLIVGLSAITFPEFADIITLCVPVVANFMFMHKWLKQ